MTGMRAAPVVMGRAGRAGRARELFGEKAEAALDMPDKYLPTAEASPVMPLMMRLTRLLM